MMEASLWEIGGRGSSGAARVAFEIAGQRGSRGKGRPAAGEPPRSRAPSHLHSPLYSLQMPSALGSLLPTISTLKFLDWIKSCTRILQTKGQHQRQIGEQGVL